MHHPGSNGTIAGVLPERLRATGIPPERLRSAGVLPERLRAAGVPPEQLRAAGLLPEWLPAAAGRRVCFAHRRTAAGVSPAGTAAPAECLPPAAAAKCSPTGAECPAAEPAQTGTAASSQCTAAAGTAPQTKCTAAECSPSANGSPTGEQPPSDCAPPPERLVSGQAVSGAADDRGGGVPPVLGSCHDRHSGYESGEHRRPRRDQRQHGRCLCEKRAGDRHRHP